MKSSRRFFNPLSLPPSEASQSKLVCHELASDVSRQIMGHSKVSSNYCGVAMFGQSICNRVALSVYVPASKCVNLPNHTLESDKSMVKVPWGCYPASNPADQKLRIDLKTNS